jgi:hypothetical protein
MKRTIITLFSAMLILLTVSQIKAQVPQGFNYQAVARNSSGTLITNQNVGIKIIIHQSSASGTPVYSETFTPATNQFGLFTIIIGQGTVVSGTFNTIAWSTGDYWIQVEMDPTGGTTYASMGAAQLLTVPYAMYSATAKTSAAAGSNGEIQFDSSGAIGANSKLFWNNTSKELGIGTTSPVAVLDIDRNDAQTNSELWIEQDGTGDPAIGFQDPGGNWSIGLDQADGSKFKIADNFSVASRTKLTIDTAGNVGLGTTTPAYKLDANGWVRFGSQSSAETGLYIDKAASSDEAWISYRTNGIDNWVAGPYGSDDYRLFDWGNGGPSNASFIITKNTDLVGIGTTTPDGQLTVVNNGAGLSATTMHLTNNNAAGIGLYVNTASTDATAVFTNSNASGNTIIAKLFDGGANDIVRFDNFFGSHYGRISLFGNNTSSALGGFLTGYGTYGLVFGDYDASGNYTDIAGVYHNTPSTTALVTYSSASLGSSTYLWSAVWATNGTIQTSDETRKENIKPVSYGLNEVMNLKPVSFQWKENKSRIGNGTNLGFLAQDLAKVLPDVVVHETISQQEIDNAKKYMGIDISNKDTYGVKYSEIIPVLVKAIQEQQAEIEMLKAEIKASNK